MKLTHSLSIPLVPHLPLTREQMRKQEQEQKRERKTGSCVEVRGTGNKVALGLRDKPGLVWDLLLAITVVIVSCNMHGNSGII